MLVRFASALERHKAELNQTQYWRYRGGRVPRMITWLLERPDLAVALAEDAVELAQQKGKSGMDSTGNPELDRVNRELDRTMTNIENLHQELEAASAGGISDPGHYEDVKEVLDSAYEYYNDLVRQWNQLKQHTRQQMARPSVN